MIFSHTDELEIPKLANAKTDPAKNIQGNGAMPLVVTHPSSSLSPLEDTLVALAKPPPCPRVESIDAALQERTGDLPNVCLLGADYMIYGFYHDWMHQNPGEHFDGRIA